MREKQLRCRHMAGAVGAVAAGLGGAPSAEAAIVYQAVDVDVPADTAEYAVNLGGGASEFNIENFTSAPDNDFYIKVDNFVAGAGALRDAVDGPVSNLAAGSLIGPGSGVFAGSGPAAITGTDGGNPTGNFQVSDGAGFIGVEFQIGVDTHYGYVGYEGAGAENSNNGRVYALAYESTPLTPIVAGAIPEPSSLALLAAGAAGVVAYRRRRTE